MQNLGLHILARVLIALHRERSRVMVHLATANQLCSRLASDVNFLMFLLYLPYEYDYFHVDLHGDLFVRSQSKSLFDGLSVYEQLTWIPMSFSLAEPRSREAV